MIIKHWMEEPTVCALPDMPIWEAARLMLDHDLRALPVLEDGRVIGVLTWDAALRGMYEAWELQALTRRAAAEPEETALADIC